MELRALGLTLARLPLAEPPLRNTRQLGNASLGKPARTERGNDRAKVVPGACVQHVRTRADTLHDPRTSAGLTAIGVLPFPWSLAPA